MQGCIYHNIKHIKEIKRISEKPVTSNVQKTKASFGSFSLNEVEGINVMTQLVGISQFETRKE